jgi:arylsulfatase A-like enzyme
LVANLRTRPNVSVPLLVGVAAVVLLFVGLRDHFVRLIATAVVGFVLAACLATPVGQRLVFGRRDLSRYDTPLGLLPLYLWIGLTAGFLEVVIVGIGKVYFFWLIWRSVDFVWMVPLSYLAILAIPTILLALLGWRWPVVSGGRFPAFVLTFCASILVLQNFSELSLWATGVLAAGVAWQVSTLMTAHRRSFNAVVHWSIGWSAPLTTSLRGGRVTGESRAAGGVLSTRRDFVASIGATVVGVALGIQAWQALAEQQKQPTLPAPGNKPPNVLLLVLDTVRAQSLGAYGYGRPTSTYVDQFAASGVSFQRALATAPWSLASHASMFTGRLPHELGVSALQPLGDQYPTLAEVLASQGYYTAGFVDNTIFGTQEFGLGRGFIHYVDFPLTWETAVLSPTVGRNLLSHTPAVEDALGTHQVTPRRGAEQLSAEFLQWQAAHSKWPFFAFLNYFDAHDPYTPPADFALRFSPHIPAARFNESKVDELTSADIRDLNNAYDGAIAYADYHVGQLLATLASRGVLDNTLVIIVGDHGEQFGEHGLMYHGNSVYMPAVHVPLLMAFPGRLPVGAAPVATVSLRDIPATVLDVLGLKARMDFPGQSLARWWSSQAGGSEVVLTEMDQTPAFPAHYPASRGALRSVVLDDLHFIKNLGDDGEELFDLEADPLEQRNLADTSSGRAAINRLTKAADRAALG